MSVSTIYATYQGYWDRIDGNWSQCISTSSRGGGNGGTMNIKLRHPDYGDYWDHISTGFIQWDTSSIPANAKISSAIFQVYVWLNNQKIGGIGLSKSTMATGWRTDGAVDEYIASNRVYTPAEGDKSTGLKNFSFKTPETDIVKAGWTKYHIGQSNFMDRVSPGIAAPSGDSNRDDWNVAGYNDSDVTKRPKLIITWTTAPVVTTSAASDIGHITATLGGNVTDAGGGTVSQRGVCWNTSTNPTTSNSKAAATGTTGAYTVSATGLTKNTLYYARAYVTTENSTTYGSVVTFTTDTDPTVTTGAATAMTPISATLSGNITSNGNGVVSTAGVCWATSENPTTSSSKTATATVLGAYTVDTGAVLLPGTLYHYRAYVTTGVSTQYGADVTFRTPGGAILFNLL